MSEQKTIAMLQQRVSELENHLALLKANQLRTGRKRAQLLEHWVETFRFDNPRFPKITNLWAEEMLCRLTDPLPISVRIPECLARLHGLNSRIVTVQPNGIIHASKTLGRCHIASSVYMGHTT